MRCGRCPVKQARRGGSQSAACGTAQGHSFLVTRSPAMTRMTRGGCLCGSVTYVLKGELRPVVACHCVQCRKTSGHYVAATQVAAEDALVSGKALTWFRSSGHAERGFCSVCGSNLFWRRVGG